MDEEMDEESNLMGFRPIESRLTLSPTFSRHRVLSGGCCVPANTTISNNVSSAAITPKLSLCWRRSNEQSWSSTGSRPSSRGAASSASSRPSSRQERVSSDFQSLSVSKRRAAFKTQKWSRSFDQSRPLNSASSSTASATSTGLATSSSVGGTRPKRKLTWRSQSSNPKSLDSGYMGTSDLVLNAWHQSIQTSQQLNQSLPCSSKAKKRDDLARSSSLPSFVENFNRHNLSFDNGRRLSVLESTHDLSKDDDEEVERIVANIVDDGHNEDKEGNDALKQESVRDSSKMHLESAPMEELCSAFHSTPQWSTYPTLAAASDVLLPSDISLMESKSNLTQLAPMVTDTQYTQQYTDLNSSLNMSCYGDSWSFPLSPSKSASPMSPMVNSPAVMEPTRLPVFSSLVKEDNFFNLWQDESVSSGPQTPESRDESNAEENSKFVCLWFGCNLQLGSQRALVEHINETHMDAKKGSDELPCLWKDCPRKLRPFNAKYKLLTHMRVHTKEKPYKCEFEGCQRSFARLENRKIHFRSHTGHKPFECKYAAELGCTKRFSNSSDRAKHEQTHKDPKPYKCEVPGCPKRYTDPSSLRKHVKSHSQEEQEEARRRANNNNNNNNLKKERILENENDDSMLELMSTDAMSVQTMASLTDVGSVEEHDSNAFLNNLPEDTFALLDGLESLLELDNGDNQSFV